MSPNMFSMAVSDGTRWKNWKTNHWKKFAVREYGFALFAINTLLLLLFSLYGWLFLIIITGCTWIG